MMVEADGRIVLSADEARKLVAELLVGTSVAKVIGEAFTDVLDEPDPDERIVLIKVTADEA